jgi:hypothetical protein
VLCALTSPLRALTLDGVPSAVCANIRVVMRCRRSQRGSRDQKMNVCLTCVRDVFTLLVLRAQWQPHARLCDTVSHNARNAHRDWR